MQKKSLNMQFFCLLSIVITELVHGSSSLGDAESEWINFKENHGKYYNTLLEENERRAIFTSNYEKIMRHNERYEQGIESYFQRVNGKTDMTIDELKKLNGFKHSPDAINPLEKIIFKPEEGASIPESFDWRDKGAISVVQDQGVCGSCWAFSATGSLEGQFFFKTGKLVPLSVQNLVDCSLNDGNAGCLGGDMVPAFKYIHNNDGIDSETGYPYTDSNNSCRYSTAFNTTSLKGYGIIKEGKEDDLKAAVATVGPISVSIDAAHIEFIGYGGGIFYNKKCKAKVDDLDHAVLVVGYGSENGHDYWLVKNSWGTRWGINGYGKMARNRKNNCGIATAGSYPIMY